MSRPPNKNLLLWIAILAVVSAPGKSVSGEETSVDAIALVDRFCVRCHGQETQEADVRLDDWETLNEVERKERWHLVARLVRSGEMPPEKESKPKDKDRQRFLDWITEHYGTPFDPRSPDHWSLESPRRSTVPSTGLWRTAESSPNAARTHSLRNPIDAFVLAGLSKSGLRPSPRADRRTLLRRISLDLVGIPPTPAEIAAFVNDKDPFEIAYGRVVDRMLQSNHFGERWAQHWLDVIRWAETVGFETNAERSNAWHYRDWVIRSLNEDKPYSEFVSQQLIGDQTGDDAALGFLVAGPANLPGQIGRDVEAMRQARQDELDEVIRTVSQSLFGLTIGCARCHDHKFDPISQRDYYSMQAIFAGLQYGTRRLRGVTNDQWAAKVSPLQAELERLKAELESKRKQSGLRPPIENVQAEPFERRLGDAVRMEIDSTNGGPPSLYEFEVWSSDTQGEARNVALQSVGARPSASSFALANQTRHFDNLTDGSVDRRQAFPWVAERAGPAWIQIDLAEPVSIDRIRWHAGSSVPIAYRVQVRDPSSGTWIDVVNTSDRQPRIDDPRKAADVHLDGLSPSQISEILALARRIRDGGRELARLSAGPQTYAARFLTSPEPTMLLHRGDPMQPREEVFATVPQVLSKGQIERETGEVERRRRLADHLTQPSHPLTARVVVNRLWQHHFGTGIVESSSDFGRSGSPPSNQPLLDWLAVELIESGWSMKHLHRLIVTSNTYTQSSHPRAKPLSIDAGSRLLWRFPPRRLEAETIRDSILAVSGKLNRSMYGRGFDFFNQRGGLSDYRPKTEFGQDGSRRMVYAHKIRMQSVDVFGAFDCPDAGQMTPRRNRSITPLQSLSMLNSPFVNRQAQFFAKRVESLAGGNPDAAIKAVFELAFGRPPTAEEAGAMLKLADQHGLEQVCRVIFNTSEFVFLQ